MHSYFENNYRQRHEKFPPSDLHVSELEGTYEENGMGPRHQLTCYADGTYNMVSKVIA
jgi:hypothetical protein